MTKNPPRFLRSAEQQPHIERCREMIKKHPEIGQLIGRNPNTFLILLAIVGAQVAVAAWLGTLGFAQYWWLALVVAYLFGAFCNHSLYVIIHDATHNLIFKKRAWNKVAAIIADIPNGFPGAIGFTTYHLKHHAHMGDYSLDADLPSDWEARMVGNSWWKKAIWLFFFPVWQVFRTARMHKVNHWNRWMYFNVFFIFGMDALLVIFFGWNALFYLIFSTMFALGLHPLGARWIQEHYTLDSSQETFSYYGPLNILALNVGYHNEHHDFPSIPWNRLPELKRMAPEYYDHLKYHTSWSKLLLEFIFNPRYSLYSRVTR